MCQRGVASKRHPQVFGAQTVKASEPPIDDADNDAGNSIYGYLLTKNTDVTRKTASPEASTHQHDT
jgi:hypothetical protein